MNRRRLAHRLVTLAGRVMPADRRAWAEAVQAELEHVDDDGEALALAAGGLETALLQRLGSAAVLRLGRLGVAGATALLGACLIAWACVLPPDLTGLGLLLNGAFAVLGLAYVGAGWSLSRRAVRGFALGLAVALGLVTAAALTLISAGVLGWSAPRPWFAALLLEEYILLTLLTTAGLTICRWEAKAAR